MNKDNTSGKNKYAWELYLILIFSLVVVLVIVLTSSASLSVKTQYDILDSVNMSGSNYQTTIGTVTITNDGILPANAQLRNLVACDFTNPGYSNYYMISYGSVGTYQSITGGDRTPYYEISSKTQKRLNIYLEGYPYLTKPAGINSTGTLEPVKLYIFDADGQYSYDYCPGASIQDAEYVITTYTYVYN